ncbi:hypothetical protein PRK78_000065 [Emydomyces testavorans]|uniref:Uncharacterized protein n=1 Tax=Emydomyces testavorans TaxID=2070801 RepID=A0AAF0DAH8_9EURO|nr:hypothetical protein PRK78_000065 [Emydomyces testavorans]
MDEDTKTTKVTILKFERDRDIWYGSIHGFVRSKRIWDLVNPDLEGEPAFLKEPKPIARPPKDTDPDTKEEYKLDLAERKEGMSRYEREQQALSKCRDQLVSGVDHPIMKELVMEEHSYVILKALKERLWPTEPERRREENTYGDMKKLKLIDKELATDELIEANERIDPIYALGWEHRHDRGTFDKVIGEFQRHYEKKPAVHKPKYQAAFLSPTSSQTPSKPTRPVSETCICGLRHWYHQCAYLNHEHKTNGWVEDPEIRRKVDEALKDPAKKNGVRKSLQKNKAYKH